MKDLKRFAFLFVVMTKMTCFVPMAECYQNPEFSLFEMDEINQQLDVAQTELSSGKAINRKDMQINIQVDQEVEANSKMEEVLDLYEAMEQDELHAMSVDKKMNTVKKEGRLRKMFDLENPLTEIDLGIESFGYEYEEPSIGVKFDDAIKYGFFFHYTKRIDDNRDIQSLKDAFNDFIKLNVFKIEAHFNWGHVDYTGSGTYDDILDFTTELRGLVGYDFFPRDDIRVTPYLGLGFRYLNNSFEDLPARMVNGQSFLSGYERESRYFYIPIGIMSSKELNDHWSFEARLEYDIFLSGVQVSHFEDMRAMDGGNPGFDKLENDQNSGYGLRGSLKIKKKSKDVDYFLEPFIRYWEIEDSEFSPTTIGGALLITDTGFVLGGIEPRNRTMEYGLRWGVSF